MAKTISLKACIRKEVGRNAVKSLRGSGRIPAVIYGKKGTQPIELNGRDLYEALHSAHTENLLVDLKLQVEGGEQTKLAFLQDVQHDPLKDTVVHVDLHEISPDEKLHAEVPIREVGEPEGVRSGGGLLETPLRRLRVECLPKDLPEEIEVPVAHLKIGDSIHVSDIVAPAGVLILNPKGQTVAAVSAPVKEEEVVAAATTEVTQPEVIKEKKVEGSPAAAGDAKAGSKPAAAAAKPPAGKK